MYRYLAAFALLTACQFMSESESEQPVAVADCDTGQWGGNAQHAGKACTPIEHPEVIGRVVVDPDAAQLNADFGFYAVHPSSVLSVGNSAIISGKRGYTDPDHKGTQTWHTQAFHWVASGSHQLLVPSWPEFTTDWHPVDVVNAFGPTNGYESLFQPALTYAAPGLPAVLYVPGVSGTLIKLSPITGAVIGRINPFAGTSFDGDAALVVNGAIAVDDATGSVAYTAVAWDPSGSAGREPRASWLITVSSTDKVSLAPWTSITPTSIGIPSSTEPCSYVFDFANPLPPFPWAPTPDAMPPQFRCTSQRPSVNDTPAFTRDGRIIVISTANNATAYAYLVAVDATTLAPVWAASLRGQIHDGCGVDIAYTETSRDMPGEMKRCRLGTRLGVDPHTNQDVAGRETGIMEVAPVIAPNGTVIVGSYSGDYDTNRGHLQLFTGAGAPLGVYPYGWESTPRVFEHDGTFSWVLDDNHFSPITGDGTGPGLDATTVRLAPDLVQQVVTRVPFDGSAAGNDFVNGQIGVDSSGNAYALNASGHLYKIAPSGAVTATVDLGASIEPLSSEATWGRDANGASVLYVAFGGTLYAIGTEGVGSSTDRGPRQLMPAMTPTGKMLRRGVSLDVPVPGR